MSEISFKSPRGQWVNETIFSLLVADTQGAVTSYTPCDLLEVSMDQKVILGMTLPASTQQDYFLSFKVRPRKQVRKISSNPSMGLKLIGVGGGRTQQYWSSLMFQEHILNSLRLSDEYMTMTMNIFYCHAYIEATVATQISIHRKRSSFQIQCGK